MTDNHTLKQWIALQEDGAFAHEDVNTQINAGWYDWFCTDKSLINRLNKMTPKVKRIAKSAKIDQKTVYVFFKNNCPMVGKLYDDFRICDVASGDVVYTIVPACGHTKNKGRAELWGRENNFKGPIVAGTMQDIYNYFGV